MLRRQHQTIISSKVRASFLTNYSVSSIRFNSSSSSKNKIDEPVSAEEIALRSKLETLAMQRLYGSNAQGSAGVTGVRSREFGAPDDKTPPAPASSETTAAASSSSSSTSSASTATTTTTKRSDLPPPPPPPAFEPKSSGLKVERHRDVSSKAAAPGSGAPQPAGKLPENISPEVAARIADLQKNHPFHNDGTDASKTATSAEAKAPQKQQQDKTSSSSSSSSTTSAFTSESTQQPPQPPHHHHHQEPVSGSPMSAQGGTKIVFDVPEGDLPQQASYDPWSILGLKPGASNHDLRVRYHELLERFHPEYVRDGSGGDVQKWAEVDRAYQLVTRAPSHDKRYRNLISDTQHFYYQYLPMWMSRNIDEMPRWWSWMRWKLPTFWFVAASLGTLYVVGKVYAYYPNMGIAALVCFVCDVLLHTTSFPVMIGVMFVTLLFSGGNVDMAWLTSPKGFLRRPLAY